MRSISRPLHLIRSILFGLLCFLGFFYFFNCLRLPITPHDSLHNALHFHDLFISSASNSTISSYLHDLTLRPHLAGTASAHRSSLYVLDHFTRHGLKTRIHEFDALLSYHTRSSLALRFPNGTSLDLPLAEPGSGTVVHPYHAYSPSGSVLADVVFVNCGKEKDYSDLREIGVKVIGRIAVARRSEISRAAVVERAAREGIVAVVMYTEGKAFMDGVERGSVMKGLGDPLTPGWGSLRGGEKMELEGIEVVQRFSRIPSMPISVKAAEMILMSIEKGEVPYEWRKTLLANVGGVGSGPVALNFTYQGEQKIAVVENIFGVIKGWEEPDRYVLLGNHRDAWTYGAVDPNSGTAALLDIARRYALLMRLGWKPRRTIILCSWDAEEFGMIGSTEWVEQNLMSLRSKAVAYLNVDCAVQGQGFFVAATPQLDDLIIQVTKKVRDPDSDGVSLYKKWIDMNKGVRIGRLSGVDSDFAPFLQHAGIPSLDLYFGTVAGVWGLLGLRLADDLILPFNYLSYAHQLRDYTDLLNKSLKDDVNLHPLITSIKELASAAIEAEKEAKHLRDVKTMDNGLFSLRKRMLNDRLMLAERGFLDADGLPEGHWFKHLIYGPCGEDEKKAGGVFPGIADAPNLKGREHEIWRVARSIRRVADALSGKLA